MMNTKSRVMGDYHARFCEGLGVKFPRSTRQNAIRPNALGRKNFLFAGSHDAAQRSAMFYSFFGTCRKHDVNPFEWLKDTLEKLPDHKSGKLDQLLPQNWKKDA